MKKLTLTAMVLSLGMMTSVSLSALNVDNDDIHPVPPPLPSLKSATISVFLYDANDHSPVFGTMSETPLGTEATIKDVITEAFKGLESIPDKSTGIGIKINFHPHVHSSEIPDSISCYSSVLPVTSGKTTVESLKEEFVSQLEDASFIWGYTHDTNPPYFCITNTGNTH